MDINEEDEEQNEDEMENRPPVLSPILPIDESQPSM